MKTKLLYKNLLNTFMTVLLMTFFICLFIILMQFLWKYIDEMVGKGIELHVLIELFFYAAMTFVPMALPLAVLLASLMTFGNLGERLELLSMKASGISLFQIMQPLIVVMVVVSIGAFYFQNIVSPMAQVKLYSLLYSVRQKSPELDIPVGQFYDQISGYNIYVNQKNTETGVLYDLMLYDYSGGFDNAAIILADSGTIKMTNDKKALFLTLYSGESFASMEKQRDRDGNQRFQRESFSSKQFLIEFDANFNRMDEGRMQNQYIGKNLDELKLTVDSVSKTLDSINLMNAAAIRNNGYLGNVSINKDDTLLKRAPIDRLINIKSVDMDSIYQRLKSDRREILANTAKTAVDRIKQDYDFRLSSIDNRRKDINRHELEWHKKFTLSFACMIFFFIGAPLGAIIRKGGIGMPAVISVFLFICYFFIDNSGYNMAREFVVPPVVGMWLSSAILLPLGIFFTYKAVNDSVIMNADTYLLFFKNLTTKPIRKVERNEIKGHIPSEDEMFETALTLYNLCDDYMNEPRIGIIREYYNYWNNESLLPIEINQQMEARAIELMKNSSDKLLILKLADFPVLQLDRFMNPFSQHRRMVRKTLFYLFPLGGVIFLFSLWGKNIFNKDVAKIRTVSLEIIQQLKKKTNNDQSLNQ
ncbi:MAG: LptF/LptG family permease [Bacteroidales bacterium]